MTGVSDAVSSGFGISGTVEILGSEITESDFWFSDSPNIGEETEVSSIFSEPLLISVIFEELSPPPQAVTNSDTKAASEYLRTFFITSPSLTTQTHNKD